MIPTDFNFSALDDDYNEDAVREDLVKPMLDALGYKPTGRVRMQRGKQLEHPYVRLGTTSRRISVIPDYLLYADERVLAVLDAKAPDEKLLAPKNVQQVYGYAIHPDVRASTFALCNGRDLVVFSVETLAPTLRLPMSEVNARWAEVEKALHHTFLEKPFLRLFKPDLGLAALRLGVDLAETTIRIHIDSLAKQDDQTLTALCYCKYDEQEFAATLDFSPILLRDIVKPLPAEKRSAVHAALSRQPFIFHVGGKIAIDMIGSYGPLTQGSYEQFVPLQIAGVMSSEYLPQVELALPVGMSDSVPRL